MAATFAYGVVLPLMTAAVNERTNGVTSSPGSTAYCRISSSPPVSTPCSSKARSGFDLIAVTVYCFFTFFVLLRML